MDGGRSTAMARWDGRSGVVVSGWGQRSVGNSIGVYYNTGPADLARAPATLSPTGAQGQDAVGQSVQVWNQGGGTLTYAIATDADWVSVAPATGQSVEESDQIQLTYHTASLGVGTYQATITITATGAGHTPQRIPVMLTVSR
jgi:hypothetical protein